MKAGTAQVSSKYDFDRNHDSARKSEREQNGRYATEQQ
jgi:hypothetical protein